MVGLQSPFPLPLPQMTIIVHTQRSSFHAWSPNALRAWADKPDDEQKAINHMGHICTASSPGIR